MQQRGRVLRTIGQGEVLLVVVPKHQRRDFVGHVDQDLVPLLLGQITRRDDLVEKDLDVHLVVGGVHPGGVVDEVGVDSTATAGVLDPPGLGQPEVSSLADTDRPEINTVDSDRVVGLVAHIRVGLVDTLDVGPDAAVPQQIHRRLEDGCHQLGRCHRFQGPAQIERRADLVIEGNRLRRAFEDPAP